MQAPGQGTGHHLSQTAIQNPVHDRPGSILPSWERYPPTLIRRGAVGAVPDNPPPGPRHVFRMGF